MRLLKSKGLADRDVTFTYQNPLRGAGECANVRSLDDILPDLQPQRIAVVDVKHVANSRSGDDFDLDGQVAFDLGKDDGGIDLSIN